MIMALAGFFTSADFLTSLATIVSSLLSAIFSGILDSLFSGM